MKLSKGFTIGQFISVTNCNFFLWKQGESSSIVYKTVTKKYIKLWCQSVWKKKSSFGFLDVCLILNYFLSIFQIPVSFLTFWNYIAFILLHVCGEHDLA